MKNQSNLETLVDSADWATLKKGIKPEVHEKFTKAVNDLSIFKKMQNMHDVCGPVTKAMHHLETCGARASWVFPVCQALGLHIVSWTEKSSTIRHFSEETRRSVKDKFVARWTGAPPNQVGLKKPAHVLATFLDPYTTPHHISLPVGWDSECRAALSQFYKDGDLESAMDELKALLLRRGAWGELIVHKQKLIEPSDEVTFENPVERIIWQQKHMGSSVEDWQLTGFVQFPLLAPIAVKLGVVAIQSADVERSCKAHKVIHTKARNRLYSKTVHLLLFTYMNLRLLNKCTKELGDFLTQTLEGCVDENDGPLSAGETTTYDEPELDIDDMTIT
jgi:hypothetical protein